LHELLNNEWCVPAGDLGQGQRVSIDRQLLDGSINSKVPHVDSLAAFEAAQQRRQQPTAQLRQDT
jgi:hypothetical protein